MINLEDLPFEIQSQVLEKENKYRNKKTEIDGIKFDSKKEARRYAELMMLHKRGEISHLRLQQEFTLMESFKTPQGKKVNGIKYRADFTYFKDGEYVIEDVKGMKTKEYELKKKLMADKGYFIKEI